MVAKQGPLLISITDYNKQETYLRAPQCHSNHRQHLGRLDTGTAIEAPHGSRAITVMGWEWDHYFPQHTAEQSTSSKTQAGLERTTLMVPVPHCLHINAGKKPGIIPFLPYKGNHKHSSIHDTQKRCFGLDYIHHLFNTSTSFIS